MCLGSIPVLHRALLSLGHDGRRLLPEKSPRRQQHATSVHIPRPRHESDPAHKEACVETKLVKIIIHYLRDLPGKVVSGLRCDQLLLGVLDCLFNSILGNEAAEDKFLALEGTGLLLFIYHFLIDLN